MNVYVKGNNVDFRYAEGKEGLLGRTFHPFYEMYLFLGGNAEYISSRTRMHLSPCQLILIPPGEYHQFILSGDDKDYKRTVITFEDESFFEIAPKEERIISLSHSHRICENYAYLRELVSVWNAEDFSHVLTALTTDILLSAKNHSQKKGKCEDNISPLAASVMEYVNVHLCEKFDLPALAEKMHASVSLMCHEFKNNFGISIKKYMLQKRLHNARRDIISGEKAEVVSLKYGFSNYASFYRAYKNTFSVAPSKTNSFK